jgi:hypothetical protein
MKVIGIELVGNKNIEVPIVVECVSFEVEKPSSIMEDFNPNECRILMRTASTSADFIIMKLERDKETGAILKHKCLSLSEVEQLMECAVASDIVDLRKLGDYKIFLGGRMPSVCIANDYDEWEDKEIPILVKIVKDGEDNDEE